jgi:hypothetical protein
LELVVLKHLDETGFAHEGVPYDDHLYKVLADLLCCRLPWSELVGCHELSLVCLHTWLCLFVYT